MAKYTDANIASEETPLTVEEIRELFVDLTFEDRMVGLVARPIQAKTKGGLIKTPDQIEKEKDELDKDGVLICFLGSKVSEERPDIVIGNYGYTASYATRVVGMQRKGYRLVVFDMNAIVIVRNPYLTPELPEEEEVIPPPEGRKKKIIT